jgi:hypothetical protein
MEQLQEIYCRYTEAAAAAKKEASPLAGLFGTGGGPKDHPCHREFFEAVYRWSEAFLANSPDEETIAQAVRMILIAAAAHKNEPTYMHCLAAQGHTRTLISRLSQESCNALRKEYEDLYPDNARLPVNQQIYALLCDGAGCSPKKKGLFSFLKK